MIEKENIKKMIIDVVEGSSYVRFELDTNISNEESFGDFLWFGEEKFMEIEIDDLDRYEDFIDEGIDNVLSRGALLYIISLKEEYNL